MVSSNPFDNVSFKTAFNIVVAVLVIIFLLIGLLSYQMGEYAGMKKICGNKSLVVNKLTEKIECYQPNNVEWNFKEVLIQ